MPVTVHGLGSTSDRGAGNVKCIGYLTRLSFYAVDDGESGQCETMIVLIGSVRMALDTYMGYCGLQYTTMKSRAMIR